MTTQEDLIQEHHMYIGGADPASYPEVYYEEMSHETNSAGAIAVTMSVSGFLSSTCTALHIDGTPSENR
jgi:hypothetical protein